MYTFGFIFLVLYISLFNKKDFDFSLEKSELLKAILPFFIIIGHCSLIFNTVPDFSKTGAVVVAIFFFISGYGLEKRKIKQGVDFNYLLKRIKSILLPLILPILTYLLTYYIIYGNIKNILTSCIANWVVILPFTWFVTKLIILYIIFYISSLFKKNNLLLFIGFLAIFDLVSIVLKAPGHTYLSDFGIIFGIFFCKHHDFIKDYKKIISFTALIIYLSLLPIIDNGKAFFIEIILVTIMLPIFISTLTIKDYYSKRIKVLKDISYEVYLSQGISFLIVEQIQCNNIYLKILLVLILTYTFAFLNKHLFNSTLNKIHFIKKK